MKKHIIKNTKELGKLLGLSEADAIEAEIKSDMMGKIRELITKEGLTHQEVADRSGVGRTVITQIVNCSIQRITIDRLIRVLVSLDTHPVIKYKNLAS
ncbi:MAG: helix-turn-helix domain-containing protein [Bdellovibrionales bacterium]|nr:helix-turn-helix domain-containing protein [Bdellovibrionales bacterium]